MKHLKLLLFTMTLTINLVRAQTDFRPGYVLTNVNDTIHGQIDYRGDLLMGQVCTFRQGENSAAVRYEPKDIMGYRFTDSKYYISKEVNGQQVFLEFLINGIVDIFYIRDAEGDHYYLEKEGDGLVEIPYEKEIKYDEERNKRYLQRSTAHNRLLNLYMFDAPGVQSRINNMRKPEHGSLIRLAEEYHYNVCEGESCIVYEKKVPLLKIDLEIPFGTSMYRSIEQNEGKQLFQAGILTHIGMTWINEKLFFRTGVLRSAMQVEGYGYQRSKKAFYKIPLQFEYIYPKGIIRPKVAYGLSFYAPPIEYDIPVNLTTSILGGLNIKLNKSLFWSLNCEIDFLPELFPLIPNKHLATTLSTGLYIKL